MSLAYIPYHTMSNPGYDKAPPVKSGASPTDYKPETRIGFPGSIYDLRLLCYSRAILYGAGPKHSPAVPTSLTDSREGVNTTPGLESRPALQDRIGLHTQRVRPWPTKKLVPVLGTSSLTSGHPALLLSLIHI